MRRLLLLLLAACFLAAIAGAAWFYGQLSAQQAPAQSIELEIPAGASSIRIAALLEEQGVIGSSLAFRLLVRLEGAAGALKSGWYRFAEPADMRDILDRLHRGDVIHFLVTVPEGLRTDEILLLLARKTQTQVNKWQHTLDRLVVGEQEGLLLPDTYEYTKPVEPGYVLSAMLRAQKQLLEELAEDAEERDRLRIIASIIEKETAVDEERPLVSAVIRNRLKKGMPLQMDPTVIYGIWRTTGSFSGNIRRRDLAADTLWNSYTRRGLPPTPIGNPGTASLRAAAAPADVGYLYFVADGSGGHAFASSLAEHQANVERWVRIERERNRGE